MQFSKKEYTRKKIYNDWWVRLENSVTLNNSGKPRDAEATLVMEFSFSTSQPLKIMFVSTGENHGMQKKNNRPFILHLLQAQYVIFLSGENILILDTYHLRTSQPFMTIDKWCTTINQGHMLRKVVCMDKYQ